MILTLTFIEDESDKEFIANLYEKYYSQLLWTAYGFVKDYQIAEDIVNTSTFKIYENISKIREIGCCKEVTYLVYIIRSISIDYLRKNQIRLKTDIMDDEVCLSIAHEKARPIDEQCINKIESENLAHYMKKLSEIDKKLIVLRYFMDKTDKEIGDELGIKWRNVGTYMNRAKTRLVKLMKEGGEYER